MTAPAIESAVLLSARQLADEARERRRAAPARRRRRVSALSGERASAG
jgi:hypothetical protein